MVGHSWFTAAITTGHSMNYGFVIDNRSCIGCHACSTACKSENQVPLGVNRTWVKYTETGAYPDVRRAFQVTRCNHCSNPPCVRICPTAAMYQRDDGIVEFDTDACIGCKACTQACPYDAIYIDPDTHTAAKCHYCSHRVDVGMEPACVVVCPEHAIIAGDLDDPSSEISRKLAKNNVTVRKPEQGTAPKVFYIEGNDIAMHPTAVSREPAGMMFADVLSLHPGHPVHAPGAKSSPPPSKTGPDSRRAPQPQGLQTGGPLNVGGKMAEHMVQVGYNAQHDIQWHWQIPTYVVTKHIAAGSFGFLAAAAILPESILPFSQVAMVGGGLLGIIMTLLTLLLLVIDLDRPDRFFYLLVRPQWRSWVARAAWILSVFSGITGLWWAVEAYSWWFAWPMPSQLRVAFAAASIVPSILASTYTAFLFAQAEGRDLWQGAHVPVQMFVHMIVFGSMPFLVDGQMGGVAQVVMAVAIACSAAITLVGDVWTPHPSEVARRAGESMVKGRYRQHFWWGGLALGHILPLLCVVLAMGTLGQVPTVLMVGTGIILSLGHYLYNTAFVMAPQEIPNS